MQVS
jgi:hypothetical protein